MRRRGRPSDESEDVQAGVQRDQRTSAREGLRNLLQPDSVSAAVSTCAPVGDGWRISAPVRRIPSSSTLWCALLPARSAWPEPSSACDTAPSALPPSAGAVFAASASLPSRYGGDGIGTLGTAWHHPRDSAVAARTQRQACRRCSEIVVDINVGDFRFTACVAPSMRSASELRGLVQHGGSAATSRRFPAAMPSRQRSCKRRTRGAGMDAIPPGLRRGERARPEPTDARRAAEGFQKIFNDDVRRLGRRWPDCGDALMAPTMLALCCGAAYRNRA